MDRTRPRVLVVGLAFVLCTALLAVAAPAAGAAAEAQSARSGLASKLSRHLDRASGSRAAYVVDAETGKAVFRYRHTRPLILASNAKLFTTAAALARFGTEGRLHTDVYGDGTLDERGVFRGSIYLRGGGDPTFGSRSFARRTYASTASVERLASALKKIGIRRITGRVYGDESRFDSRRGGPDSRYGVSVYVGPLSALSFNRGLAPSSRGFQRNPPATAAAALDGALKRIGVRVAKKPGTRRLPRQSERLATVQSPTMSRLAALTNKPSDNFFAEILIKALAMQASGRGTTGLGARLVDRFAARLGGNPAGLADGSGLSRGDRASAFRVVKLLTSMRTRDEWPAFYRSLPIAGREGTLSRRMRSGPARGSCRAKTGTLSNVSALSGYCRSRSGRTYIFSVLANSAYTPQAKATEDAVAQTLAGAR